MESKKLSFNWRMIKRDILRNWPIWGATTAIFLLTITGTLGLFTYYDKTERQVIKEVISWLLMVSSFASIVLGLFVALAAFGYLGSKKKHYFYEFLPMNRISLFTTRFLFGFIVMMIPCIIIYLVELIQIFSTTGYFIIGSMTAWLAIMAVQNLFWFAFGTLFVVLCGRRLMAGILYAAFAFVGILIEYTIAVYNSFMFIGYGRSFSTNDVLDIGIFSPIEYIFSNKLYYGTYSYINDGDYVNIDGIFGTGKLIVVLISALVLIAASLVLYRKRECERTEDNIVFKMFKPVLSSLFTIFFTIEMTLLMVGIFASQAEGFSHVPAYRIFIIVLIIIFGYIGYMISCMIIEKSFKVFKKNFIKASVVTGAMIIFMILYMHDIFGFETKVPNIDDITTCYVSGDQYQSERYYSETQMSKDDIQKVIELHNIILGHLDEVIEFNNEKNGIGYLFREASVVIRGVEYRDSNGKKLDIGDRIFIDYNLKNGNNVYRDYYIIPEGSLYEELKAYVNKYPDFFLPGDADVQYYFD